MSDKTSTDKPRIDLGDLDPAPESSLWDLRDDEVVLVSGGLMALHGTCSCGCVDDCG